MKKLLPIFLLFAACSPSRYLECPTAKTNNIGCNKLSVGVCFLPDTRYDTIPEWMHVSATRAKGFVIARKALSVRVNGYCVTHLDCDKKPFPVHYHIGWCQGKDELLTAFLNERRAKQ